VMSWPSQYPGSDCRGTKAGTGMDSEEQLLDRPKRDSMSLEEATISSMWEINEADRLALIC